MDFVSNETETQIRTRHKLYVLSNYQYYQCLYTRNEGVPMYFVANARPSGVGSVKARSIFRNGKPSKKLALK